MKPDPNTDPQKPPDTSALVRGYRVRVRWRQAGEPEARRRREALVRVVAAALLRRAAEARQAATIGPGDTNTDDLDR